MYEALAGAVPFEGNFGEVLLKVSTEALPSLTKRCPEVPIDLERVIAKAVARVPQERYWSPREFAEALSLIPTGETTSLLGIRAPALRPLAGGQGAVRPAKAMVPPRPASAGTPSIAGAAPPQPVSAQPATRRRFARAPYVTPARIIRTSGAAFDGRSEDISVGGLLVLAPQAFEHEEHVKVRFALPITGKLLEVAAIARWVKKARGTGAVGLEFAALAPSHLAVIENYVIAMGGA